MVIVEFYTYTDDTSGLDELGNNIVDRFKQDYPDATSEVNYNEDKELFSININIEGDDIPVSRGSSGKTSTTKYVLDVTRHINPRSAVVEVHPVIGGVVVDLTPGRS